MKTLLIGCSPNAACILARVSRFSKSKNVSTVFSSHAVGTFCTLSATRIWSQRLSSLNRPGCLRLNRVSIHWWQCTPAHLDLRRLQGLVAARRSAAEDHIRSLREDPGYFADAVLDMKENRQEILPDTIGQRHPLMRPSPSSRFWERMLGNLITAAYLSVGDLG